MFHPNTTKRFDKIKNLRGDFLEELHAIPVSHIVIMLLENGICFYVYLVFTVTVLANSTIVCIVNELVSKAIKRSIVHFNSLSHNPDF